MHPRVSLQSDWMVGQCVQERGVRPVLNLSCGLCQNYCSHQMKSALTRVAGHLDAGCAFAQVEVGVLTACPLRDAAAVPIAKLCRTAPRTAAVTHGFSKLTRLYNGTACLSDAQARAKVRSFEEMLNALAVRFWASGASREERLETWRRVNLYYSHLYGVVDGQSPEKIRLELRHTLQLTNSERSYAVAASYSVAAVPKSTGGLTRSGVAPAEQGPCQRSKAPLVRWLLPTLLHVQLVLQRGDDVLTDAFGVRAAAAARASPTSGGERHHKGGSMADALSTLHLLALYVTHRDRALHGRSGGGGGGGRGGAATEEPGSLPDFDARPPAVGAAVTQATPYRAPQLSRLFADAANTALAREHRLLVSARNRSSSCDGPDIAAGLSDAGLGPTSADVLQVISRHRARRPYRLRLADRSVAVDLLVVTADVEPLEAIWADDTVLVRTLSRCISAGIRIVVCCTCLVD